MSVEITQADREAAAQIYIWFPALCSSVEAAHKTAQLIRDGGADGWNSVRLMRDHRHQAEEAMRERAAAICDYHVDKFADAENAGDDEAEEAWHGGMAHAAQRLAAAIRSIDTRGE